MKQSEGVVGTGQEADAYRAGGVTVTPLRKRRLSGELQSATRRQKRSSPNWRCCRATR